MATNTVIYLFSLFSFCNIALERLHYSAFAEARKQSPNQFTSTIKTYFTLTVLQVSSVLVCSVSSIVLSSPPQDVLLHNPGIPLTWSKLSSLVKRQRRLPELQTCIRIFHFIHSVLHIGFHFLAQSKSHG